MSVPVGTIIAWYGDPLKRPNFYEFCDGSTLTLPAQEVLAGYLVAANPALLIRPGVVNLPDLRGEFLRGFDDNRNVDVDRINRFNRSSRIGTFQDEEFKNHTHGIKGAGPNVLRDGSFALENVGRTEFAQTTATGGRETRPRNVTVSFLVKATKNGEERPLSELLGQVTASGTANAAVISFLQSLIAKGI